MDLYFLRHADAVEIGKHGITRDADRPLTAAGSKKVKKIAKGMQKMGLSFEAILSSPYLRAKETAEIVGEVLECSSLVRLTPHLVVGGDPTALMKEINEDYSHNEQLLLVGHEPFLSGLISVLISGQQNASIRMKKCGFCKLSVGSLHYGRCATLEWLMPSSQLGT